MIEKAYFFSYKLSAGPHSTLCTGSQYVVAETIKELSKKFANGFNANLAENKRKFCEVVGCHELTVKIENIQIIPLI
jgi:hypothetical protein